jgi:hypothetical protein
MVFPYYKKLSRNQKRIYLESDRITAIRLPSGHRLKPLVLELSRILKTEDREKTEALCQQFATGLTELLEVPPVQIRVFAKRPSSDWGELHGLYEPNDPPVLSRITVWMRTAQRRQVVAFRTFLRTLLHELCHHLDYELFKLPETFHTEGFYKRESSLLHQLLDQ